MWLDACFLAWFQAGPVYPVHLKRSQNLTVCHRTSIISHFGIHHVLAPCLTIFPHASTVYVFFLHASTSTASTPHPHAPPRGRSARSTCDGRPVRPTRASVPATVCCDSTRPVNGASKRWILPRAEPVPRNDLQPSRFGPVGPQNAGGEWPQKAGSSQGMAGDGGRSRLRFT